MATYRIADKLSGNEEDTPGLRLKKKRLAAGMSQEDLAEMIDTSGQSIHRYETGKRKMSLPLLRQMSSIFRCPVADFIPNGDGISDEERELIHWIRSHPRDRAVVFSTYRSLRDSADDDDSREDG